MFNAKWNNLYSQMDIVSGKEVLRKFRESIQERFNITFLSFGGLSYMAVSLNQVQGQVFMSD